MAGIKEVVTAPRSPWQNSYVERLIGSIRRECLDHVIIFNEHHFARRPAAGEALGYDRYLKSNTTKRRTHSLSPAGLHALRIYPHNAGGAIAAVDVVSRVLERFTTMLAELPVFC